MKTILLVVNPAEGLWGLSDDSGRVALSLKPNGVLTAISSTNTENKVALPQSPVVVASLGSFPEDNQTSWRAASKTTFAAVLIHWGGGENPPESAVKNLSALLNMNSANLRKCLVPYSVAGDQVAKETAIGAWVQDFARVVQSGRQERMRGSLNVLVQACQSLGARKTFSTNWSEALKNNAECLCKWLVPALMPGILREKLSESVLALSLANEKEAAECLAGVRRLLYAKNCDEGLLAAVNLWAKQFGKSTSRASIRTLQTQLQKLLPPSSKPTAGTRKSEAKDFGRKIMEVADELVRCISEQHNA